MQRMPTASQAAAMASGSKAVAASTKPVKPFFTISTAAISAESYSASSSSALIQRS